LKIRKMNGKKRINMLEIDKKKDFEKVKNHGLAAYQNRHK